MEKKLSCTMSLNMKNIAGCDELIEYLRRKTIDREIVQFEGTFCEIGGVEPDTDGLFILNPKFPNTLFIVGETYNGHTYDREYCDPYKVFDFFVITGSAFRLDEAACITLPEYVKDELIATAKGEW